MTFKAFLSTQDDSITDEEALTKYGEYKLEFQRQQLNEFFVTHKDEEWFKEKYHPLSRSERNGVEKDQISRRLAAFSTLVTQDSVVKICETEETELVRLMDRVVVLLEGGTTDDLDIVDMESTDDKRQLHRTTSVFLNNLHPSITREEIETVAKKFPGYLRLALSPPDSNNKFARKCWISFHREAKIREICFSLNSQKIRVHELKSVVNKDLSKRVRTVDKIAAHPRVVESFMETAARITLALDKKAGLYVSDTNPLLDENERELDKLILYLRVVHSVDFYKGVDYAVEDEMPNRCGLLHVRPVGEQAEVSDKEITEYLDRFNEKMEKIISDLEVKLLPEDKASKLGLRKEEYEVEKFISGSMTEVESDKWLCTLSGKKFKAPEFVRKHIMNKFSDKVESVKTEVEFFNNFILDEGRPSQPAPLPVKRPPPSDPPAAQLEPLKRAAPQDARDDYQPPVKKSVKERLGNGGVRVTYSAPDPRDIIDYSDVDSFAFDFDY